MKPSSGHARCVYPETLLTSRLSLEYHKKGGAGISLFVLTKSALLLIAARLSQAIMLNETWLKYGLSANDLDSER